MPRTVAVLASRKNVEELAQDIHRRSSEIMKHLMKARFKFTVPLFDLTSKGGEKATALKPSTSHIRAVTHGKAVTAEIRQANLAVQEKKMNEDMVHQSAFIVKKLYE